jgi:hypothetical protein
MTVGVPPPKERLPEMPVIKTPTFQVTVFTNEIPNGTWGGAARINTLADIVGYIVDDPKAGRAYAERRLSGRRAAIVSG